MNVMKSMGGHFSAFLEGRKNKLPSAYGYESARSSLYMLLKAAHSKRVFLPNYICDAVPAAVEAAGAQLVYYPINEHFQPVERLNPSPEDWVLLVNYFGLCSRAIEKSLDYLPAPQVIVDCSQAYFFDDHQQTSKIYSPRKFLPVADGGFVRTEFSLNASAFDNNASIRRYQYLLERTVEQPELSRASYLQAEKDLESINDRSISSFTKKICETTDVDFIRQRRRENFKILQGLDFVNALKFDLGEQVPLCYPLMVANGREIRENLLRIRIFTPKYWPNVTPRNDFEKLLLEETVFLPVDHRYTAEQMNFLLNIVVQINQPRS